MHAPKFYQESYYNDNDFFDGKAYIIPVLENKEMDDALRSLKDGKLQHKDADKPSKSQKPQRKPEKVVIDLHLTEIIDNEAGMTPKDMLDYQMKVFREKLDECIADPHVKKVVFIHGKGNGSLKLELRKCLDRNYKRCQYQDASFEEYGGGATLVYVK
jgi:dsDNA-specific endonuclease/ATPase MutS2